MGEVEAMVAALSVAAMAVVTEDAVMEVVAAMAAEAAALGTEEVEAAAGS